MPALEDDLKLLAGAVREGGAIARRYTQGATKNWQKTNGTSVSEADLAVDRFLNQRLLGARPDYGWLSEESEDDPARLAARRVFVVDPIDGTDAFLKGKPHFTICAGLVEDGEPIAAAVYNPLTEECFTAAKAGGAWLNGASIAASNRADLEGCRILVRKGLLKKPVWSEPWPAMDVEDRGSAAYRLVLVAAGIFDATISLTSKCDWDLAAADLIVREAGGLATTHDGVVPRYNRANVVKPSIIAAGPRLHAAILARTRLFNLKDA